VYRVESGATEYLQVQMETEQIGDQVGLTLDDRKRRRMHSHIGLGWMISRAFFVNPSLGKLRKASFNVS